MRVSSSASACVFWSGLFDYKVLAYLDIFYPYEFSFAHVQLEYSIKELLILAHPYLNMYIRLICLISFHPHNKLLSNMHYSQMADEAQNG